MADDTASGETHRSGSTVGSTAPSQRVLVASGYTGHHLPYLRLIWQQASASGLKVVAALPSAAKESKELALHLAPTQQNLELVFVDDPVSPKSTAQLAREVGASQVIVPNGDRFMMKLAIAPLLPRGITYTTLIMQDPRWEIGATRKLHLKARLKLTLAFCASARRRVKVVWLRGPGYRGSSTERYVNDPVIPGSGDGASRVSRELAALDPEKYWFAMIGVTNWWKNPELVLDALAEVASDKVGLLIAGPISPSLAPAIMQQVDQLQASGITVVVLDTHITNGEMNDAVRAADCVVVAYSTHAPPSSIGKVGAYGSRVIVAGSKTLQAHAEFLSDRAIRCDLNKRSIAAAMRSAISSPPTTGRLSVPDHFASVLLNNGRKDEPEQQRNPG